MPNIENSEELDPLTPLRDQPSAPPNDLNGVEAQTNAERQEQTPYHNATVDAFGYQLHNYKENDDVAIIDEHRLSKEPLRIDIIVVKKNREIELKPAWAKIFRRHNIIEYKSPVDTPPTPDVFDKLIGYARIYAAQEKVKISDVTATIICADPPEKLFKILEDEFYYEILPKEAGIYYIVQKGVPVEKTLAIQIATYKSDLLLQALDKKTLDEDTADKLKEFILIEAGKHRNKLGYWIKAIPPENLKYIFERTEDMATREFFMELMETSGLSDYIMQKGMQQGRLEGMQEGRLEGMQEGRLEGMQKGMQKGRLEGAQEVIDLLEKGYSLSDAKKMLQLT